MSICVLTVASLSVAGVAIHILAGVVDEAEASVSISGVSTTQCACDVHQALIDV